MLSFKLMPFQIILKIVSIDPGLSKGKEIEILLAWISLCSGSQELKISRILGMTSLIDLKMIS